MPFVNPFNVAWLAASAALAVEGLLEGTPRVEVLLSRADRLGITGRRDEEREAVAEALRDVAAAPSATPIVPTPAAAR